MKIATAANSRTAQAASDSLNKGLNVAFFFGAVMGFTMVGLGLLDISVWFRMWPTLTLSRSLRSWLYLVWAPPLWPCLPVWAAVSSPRLLTWVLIWWGRSRLESLKTPPATIADNVGDVADTGADDLYESYVGSILATFDLGVAAYPGHTWGAMLLPIALAVVGIICSILDSFLIRTREGATQRELLGTLRKGTYSAALLPAILAAPSPISVWVTGASTLPSSVA